MIIDIIFVALGFSFFAGVLIGTQLYHAGDEWDKHSY